MSRAALSLVLLFSLHTHAFELARSSDGGVLRWGAPLELLVDARLDESLQAPGALEAVQQAVDGVAGQVPQLGLKARAEEALTPGFDPGPGAVNRSVVVASREWLFESNHLAVTVMSINTRTGEILDADILLNVRAHRFAVVQPDSTGALNDVGNTVNHELGHALGLAHNPEDPAVVMFPLSSHLETLKRTLSRDDLDGLLTLYPGPLAPPVSIPEMGCQTAPAATATLLLALLLLAATAARPRLALALATCALFLPGATQWPAVLPAPQVQGEVVARSSRWEGGFIVTELTVQTQVEGRVRAWMVGGEVGEVAQLVPHAPVPRLHSVVRLQQRNGGFEVEP